MALIVKYLFHPSFIVCSFLVYFSMTVFTYAETGQGDIPVSLNTDQIKNALIGNSVTGTTRDSAVPFTVYYPKHGMMRGEAGLWGLFTDEGTWSVEDGLYCAVWQKWADGEQLCFRVYLDDDVIHWVLPDGKPYSSDSLVSGNPAGL